MDFFNHRQHVARGEIYVKFMLHQHHIEPLNCYTHRLTNDVNANSELSWWFSVGSVLCTSLDDNKITSDDSREFKIDFYLFDLEW
jgi:hypothetical protein